MCGICGIYDFRGRPADAADLRRMMREMKHRGPDDEGVFTERHAGLGHVRLSIIDLSPSGHQPMADVANQLQIVFNGEIYNYIELKQELAGHYDFRTRSDTEVILAAYRHWGKACLERFNGDFAFAVYDRRQDVLFAARDRFGIKPFFFHHDGDRLWFASEIRALLPFLPERRVNDRAVFEYLLYNRTDQSAQTFLESVLRLPHGHCLTVSGGRMTQERWYDLPARVHRRDMSSAAYRDLLSSAVGLRLRSDVPVGACLSGGLDSSSLVSILLHDFRKADLHTFSAVYGPGEAADESAFIGEFSDRLANMFYVRPTADTLLADLPRFVAAHPEPVSVLGPYAQFKVMEVARSRVTVTLDGQGADEQLAGYHYFFGGYFKELLATARLLRLAAEAAAYLRRHRSLLAFRYMAYYLLPPALRQRLAARAGNCIAEDFFARQRNASRIDVDLYQPATLNESLLQHFEFKLEHLLRWEDHNGMFHSLEPRVPFLDHRLVEATLSLPAERVIRRGVTKVILRESVADILPERIRRRRDKLGFPTPADKWFRTPAWRQQILDLVHSASFRQRGYLRADGCASACRRHLDGTGSAAREIWKWLQLELWLRAYVDAPTGREETR